jgi:hypothetical protein
MNFGHRCTQIFESLAWILEHLHNHYRHIVVLGGSGGEGVGVVD